LINTAALNRTKKWSNGVLECWINEIETWNYGKME
jgi:hypothetical protein